MISFNSPNISQQFKTGIFIHQQISGHTERPVNKLGRLV